MKWPWLSRATLERYQVAGERAWHARTAELEALHAEIAGLKAALAHRTEELGFAKEVAVRGDGLLDSIERVDALYVQRHMGETWKEYNRRIAQAFKDGADSTLLQAILDEIGRWERDAFVQATAMTDPMKLVSVMGSVSMARTLKARLLTLTGLADRMTARDKERRTRTEMGFSDAEDKILAEQVLEGRLPRR